MKKLGPQNWVVLIYHVFIILMVLMTWLVGNKINDSDTIKAAIAVLGGGYVIYQTLNNYHTSLIFAIPFYILMAIVIQTDNITWSALATHFISAGESTSFTSSLFVGFNTVSFDEVGQVKSLKGLNLVPLAICLLTQMGVHSHVEYENKEEILDDSWSEE